ncbi:zf-HC2 domain-containing protein [Acidicapsa dinghuensis]|uniref:Zf-HC2 domain-containing protein n=1 Tax=Acidicapsa dinghuensis TaxID=2218256 RepID=A0ABW1ENC3_9BACT|nr:zf-HC2 domain-containing protein [Acidicapsa dinghuensis]
MDHSEAVNAMMAERYLLNELSADERDAFEEHFFDCAECAIDVRAGAAFVQEAKAQLPGLTLEAAPRVRSTEAPAKKDSSWLDRLRPLFASPLIAGPVFAGLIAIVGYQNLVTVPGLRTAATEPRLLAPVTLHGATRGEPVTIDADLNAGVVLMVDVPVRPDITSYSLALTDPQGKLAWTRSVTSDTIAAQGDSLSLVIPGSGLQSGTYSLQISGSLPAGTQTQLEQMSLTIRLKN